MCISVWVCLASTHRRALLANTLGTSSSSSASTLSDRRAPFCGVRAREEFEIDRDTCRDVDTAVLEEKLEYAKMTPNTKGTQALEEREGQRKKETQRDGGNERERERERKREKERERKSEKSEKARVRDKETHGERKRERA